MVYCALLCCVLLCCAALRCAVMCCAVLLCCTVLRFAVLCCTVLCCVVLRCAVLRSAVLWCVALCYAMLCCAALRCAVLCWTVLCSPVTAVLCYAGVGDPHATIPRDSSLRMMTRTTIVAVVLTNGPPHQTEKSRQKILTWTACDSLHLLIFSWQVNYATGCTV